MSVACPDKTDAVRTWRMTFGFVKNGATTGTTAMNMAVVVLAAAALNEAQANWLTVKVTKVIAIAGK